MSADAKRLEQFLAMHSNLMLARLAFVKGSSPRAEGTSMLIAEEAIFGTIGGGALEHMVIDKARQMLRQSQYEEMLDISLGPEIGQCCGGRMRVNLSRLDAPGAKALLDDAAAEEAAQTPVFIFGAGHVGRALAEALVPLPVRAEVIDTRPKEIESLPQGILGRAVALPEAVIRTAPKGSAFVIVTHDHALDFLLAYEALARDDAPYIGMIGSRTKRAKFAHWYRQQGGDTARLGRLVLPIGAQGLGDKRPAVIAALAAAEIMIELGKQGFKPERSTRSDQWNAFHEL